MGERFSKDSQLRKMNGNRGSKHFIYMNRTFGLYNLMFDLKANHVIIDTSKIMIKFSHEDINAMHHLYRINLINSCSGYKSANLIGTKSRSGISNVVVFSSVTHLGQSCCFGLFLRPTTVLRNTYENILETKSYTINHIHQDIIEDAHHTR